VYIVNFRTLKIKNFLSVGEVPISIVFNKGVNIITGVNKDKEDSKNGVGKSTIVDALYFTLYGTTIRDLNKDLIVNSVNKKNCETTLVLDIDTGSQINTFTITRQLAPSKCTVTKDGEDITLSTIAKTNEFIQKLIKTPGNVFQNSVVMSLNSTLPFMMLSKIDKRKFIENILNLEVFSRMLSITREEYNTLKKDYEVFFTKKQLLDQALEKHSTQIEFFEQNKKTRIDSFLQKINQLQRDLNTIEGDIINIPDNIFELLQKKEQTITEQIKDVNEQYENIFCKITELKSEISVKIKQKETLQKINAVCPTCQRPFTEQSTHRQDEINITDSDITNLHTKLTPLSNDLEQIKQNKKSLQETEQQISIKRKKINEQLLKNQSIKDKKILFENNIEQYKQDVIQIQAEVNTPLLQEIEQTKHQLQDVNIKIETLNTDLHILDAVKFIVSEEGVKTYIVKKILNALNERVNFYLKKLNANCICTYNEFFEDKIIDEQGTEKSYHNFSGGERKRIDLACLFAFLDIRKLQGDVNFSTIFYDELIDSALDEKGIELTLNILKERQAIHNENSYIITHRGSTMLDGINTIITLEKRNGKTYLLKQTNEL
jgi:DNA repair exonuclease SbcCD ATPase subunit